MPRFFRATVFSAALILFTMGLSSAQKPRGGFFKDRFTAAAGVSFALPEQNVPAAAGILFSPQLFLTTTYTDFSVSVNPSPQLFYSFSDSQSVSQKLFFQLPAMLHINFGHLASKDFRSTNGFFVGAGWNFQLGHGESRNGFALDGGVRFWLFGQSFTLMYQRLTDTEKIFSSDNFFSLHINLGKYLSSVKANNKVSNFMKPYKDKK